MGACIQCYGLWGRLPGDSQLQIEPQYSKPEAYETLSLEATGQETLTSARDVSLILVPPGRNMEVDGESIEVSV